MESQDATEVTKPKKARAPRQPAAPKPPKPVEELVAHALKLAATNPKAKWLGASAASLFSNKEANTEAAIKSCLDTNRPLLTKTGDTGALTAAGFELIATDVPEEEVGALAKGVAARLSDSERADFLHAVIGRTSAAAAELTPLFEEAVAAEKASRAAREAEAAARRAAEEASQKALQRALALIAERQQARVAELLRLLEIEGEKATAPKPRAETPAPPASNMPSPVARTEADKSFRRDVADQLAAAWRATWDADKAEAREFVESAMWNISGLRLNGEPGERVTYSGRYHDSVAGVASGDGVRIVRPGWVLDEDGNDYVALKAVIAK